MRVLLVVSGLLGLAAPGTARNVEIKKVPIRPTPAESGQATKHHGRASQPVPQSVAARARLALSGARSS